MTKELLVQAYKGLEDWERNHPGEFISESSEKFHWKNRALVSETKLREIRNELASMRDMLK